MKTYTFYVICRAAYTETIIVQEKAYASLQAFYSVRSTFPNAASITEVH